MTDFVDATLYAYRAMYPKKRLLVVSDSVAAFNAWCDAVSVRYGQAIRVGTHGRGDHVRGFRERGVAIVLLPPHDGSKPPISWPAPYPILYYAQLGAKIFAPDDKLGILKFLRGDHVTMKQIEADDAMVIYDAWLEGRPEWSVMLAEQGMLEIGQRAVEGWFVGARERGYTIAGIVWFEETGTIISVDCIYTKDVP